MPYICLLYMTLKSRSTCHKNMTFMTRSTYQIITVSQPFETRILFFSSLFTLSTYHIALYINWIELETKEKNKTKQELNITRVQDPNRLKEPERNQSWAESFLCTRFCSHNCYLWTFTICQKVIVALKKTILGIHCQQHNWLEQWLEQSYS